MASLVHGLNGQIVQNSVQQMSTLGMIRTEEQDQKLLCGRIWRTRGIVVKNRMKFGGHLILVPMKLKKKNAVLTRNVQVSICIKTSGINN